MEKLVRDKIPEIIADNGEEAIYRYAFPDERMKLVSDKFVEEKTELDQAIETGNKDEVKRELADLLEVYLFAQSVKHPEAGAFFAGFDEVLSKSELDYKAVDEARIEKREERGGFESWTILIEN